MRFPPVRNLPNENLLVFGSSGKSLIFRYLPHWLKQLQHRSQEDAALHLGQSLLLGNLYKLATDWISMDTLIFGTSGIPHIARGLPTQEAIPQIRKLGLDAMELEFVHSINISREKAPLVKEEIGRASC